MTQRLAFVGGGRMGEALIAGALRGTVTPPDVVVIEPVAERAQYLRQQYGVAAGSDAAAVANADVVVLAVKPDQVSTVCAQISAYLSAEVLVVSVAAGITTTVLEAALPDGTSVVLSLIHI